MRQSDKQIMINLSMEKAQKALISAEENFKSNQLETALNRNYYAVFYSVMALGYKNDFVTSKHSKLMGWFNKKFIHEDKIFDSEMFETYSKAFERRQKCDYDITYKATPKMVKKLIEKSKYFVSQIEKQI
jgi:uncharacterized protein (UPF0332 family)